MRLHGACSNASLEELSTSVSSNLHSMENVRKCYYSFRFMGCLFDLHILRPFDVVLGCRDC